MLALIIDGAKAQLIEFSGTSGRSVATKIADTTKIGKENFVGANLKVFAKKGYGIVASVKNSNSYLDTVGFQRQHTTLGIGFGKTDMAESMGMNNYDVFGYISAGYMSDKKTSEITYLSDKDTTVWQKINSTHGGFAEGEFGLYLDENKTKFFGGGSVLAEIEVPIRTRLITQLGSDTVGTKLTAEDKALVFYTVHLDVEAFSFRLSQKLALAGDFIFTVNNLNDFQFGTMTSTGGELKLNCYDGNEFNHKLNILSFGMYGLKHANFAGLGGYVKLDLVALFNAIKK